MIARLRATVPGEIAWAAGVALAFTLHAMAVTSAFTRPDLIDFAAFVDNARAWVHGAPYPETARDPNTPHMLLVFVPFINMPARTGLAIWLALSYLCALFALRITTAETGTRPAGAALVTAAAVFAAAPPTLGMVVDGNMAWVLWALFALAWRADRRGATVSSALLMGALISVKPFLGLWFGHWLLRGRWISLVAGFVGLVTSVAFGVLTAGFGAWHAWFDMLGRIDWYGSSRNASAIGFAARISGEPYGLVGAALAVLITGAATWSLWRHRTRADIDLDWLVVTLTALLLSPLSWRYYLCFALGPALGALRYITPGERLALLLLALAPAVAIDTPSVVLRATVGSIAFWALFWMWRIAMRAAVRGRES